jgi:hypothetical protein
MRDAERPVDYSRAKASALEQLAASGDRQAIRELERRGIRPGDALDLARLDYLALRRLVQAWRQGVLPEDRKQSAELARRAQAELEIRYRVDLKLYDGTGRAPQAPPAPPWEAPRHPRCTDWRRPGGSTLYPPERR